MSEEVDGWDEMVIAFMAKERGLDASNLTEDQEYELLMEFNDCEKLWPHFAVWRGE